jgi:hypothetical protein
MNSKTFVGACFASIILFLFGWLTFGFLLVNYYDSNLVQYPGLIKNPPDILPIAISNLTSGFLISWIFSIAKIKNIRKGFSTGFIIVSTMVLCYDLFIYAQMNLYSIKLIIADVLLNGVTGGITGIVLGWWFKYDLNGKHLP